MKKVMLIAVTLMATLLFVGGCGEEFAVGFGTGAAAMKTMADDAQEKFEIAVGELNAETKRLNTEIAVVKGIDVEDFIKPETVQAIKGLRGREKDPATWIALASILANAIWGGKTIGERKKK